MKRACLTVGALVVAAAALPLVGEAQSARGTGQTSSSWRVPRTPWGHPDLQGVWSNTTTTPLERPDDLADKAVLTGEELRKRDAEVAERVSLDRPLQRGNPGAYNEFWMERGALINRTSLIIDPPNGKFPPLAPAGQKRQEALTAARKEAPADSWLDRSAYDRCISRGMPGAMMPGFYNHNYQILQTPDHVVVHVEMIHDVRIIPLGNRPHLTPNVRLWLGDSRGRWEGDTLVVETTNVNDKVFEIRAGGALFGVGGDLKLIERFTRIAPDTIDYQFTIDAPSVYSRPWTVGTPMIRLDSPLFEYACHEGNYALPGILSGARADERAKAADGTGERR
jgi:hypothetical protein